MNSHLELCIEDLHVQSVFSYLLLTDPFRLRLITFLVTKGEDLMVLRETLDELGFDLCGGLLDAMSMRSNPQAVPGERTS